MTKTKLQAAYVPRFQTQFNYDHSKQKYRVCELVSLTQPDQSMGIKEMLVRHKNGTLDGIGLTGNAGQRLFDEHNPYPGINFATLDLTEIHQLKKDAEANYQELVKKYEGDKKNKWLEYVKGLTDRIKELETPPPPDSNKN